jgi:hypothetical protein
LRRHHHHGLRLHHHHGLRWHHHLLRFHRNRWRSYPFWLRQILSSRYLVLLCFLLAAAVPYYHDYDDDKDKTTDSSTYSSTNNTTTSIFFRAEVRPLVVYFLSRRAILRRGVGCSRGSSWTYVRGAVEIQWKVVLVVFCAVLLVSIVVPWPYWILVFSIIISSFRRTIECISIKGRLSWRAILSGRVAVPWTNWYAIEILIVKFSLAWRAILTTLELSRFCLWSFQNLLSICLRCWHHFYNWRGTCNCCAKHRNYCCND